MKTTLARSRSASLLVAPLLVVAPVLAGCSGTSSNSSAPSAGSATSATSAAAPSSATSASSGAATSGVSPTPAGIPSSVLQQAQRKAANLCAMIPLAKMNSLLGSDFGSTSGGTNGVPCSYTAKRGTKVGADAGAITGISARTTASLQDEAKAIGAKYGLTQVKAITVAGATNAFQVAGTNQGVNAAVVVAEKDGVSYDALCGGSRSSATYATGLVKVVTALIAA